ncbi:MAG: FeoA family protein [Pseudomonadota bacterium]|nr:FeoA family protein [Pseudomonadota bacterium]MDP1902700.1 FeoA family protein [Pseudomonadota bacterium]MDP2351038.1 FeoA family protein [Pseudomonadota bacterium]
MTQTLALCDLAAGRCGTIVRIDAGLELGARMRALGLLPGRRVKVIRRSPFRGPIQVRAGQTDLIIRRGEAAAIMLLPCPAEAGCA